MNNMTYSVKKSEIQRKWYIIDAANKPLGRVATEAARLLRGKHKPTYTPNMDVGDHVIILNCKDAVLTGRKLDQKVYRQKFKIDKSLSECRGVFYNQDRLLLYHTIKFNYF